MANTAETSAGQTSPTNEGATDPSTVAGQAPSAVPGALATDGYLPFAPAGALALPEGDARVHVLDWAGFKGALSYTFDDANSSQVNNYDALQALGVPMTFYLQTNKSDAKSEVWARAVADGHELANHTKSHLADGETIGQDTDDATVFIKENFGVDVWTMAAPFGSADYRDIALTRFMINRGVNDRLIKPNDNADPLNLNCYVPPEAAGADLFNAKADAAQAGGGWQLFLVHGFTGGTDGAYQPMEFDQFIQAVEYAKSKGDLWLGSVVDIGAYWIGQKLFNQIEPSVAETEQTWQWALPDHFPPGKILRVTVASGSLAQAGTTLELQAGGYYVVSLDVGMLTWTP